MVHVYCVGGHMYTTDCDIIFLVFQCTLLQSSLLRRIQHNYFLQVQPITACTVTTISFHRVPIGLSVQGQHWLETSTSTSIYDLWWDLLILNFMFFLISHNFHSYDCFSIMMTVMSRLWLSSDSSAVLWYAVMKYCRRRILWQNCMSLKVI